MLFAANRKLKITVSESRPKNEGKITAKRLSKIGIPVKYITEAMLAGEVSKCDAAIIGADKILN